MPFKVNDSLRYFTFQSFTRPGVVHAMFTRRGGTSPEPWESLNMGSLVGDDIQRVEFNRTSAFQAVGRDPESMYDVWQVHSTEVALAHNPRPLGHPHLKADAILTNNPGVTLFMRFADCVPILLFDPVKKVVGLVHSGWIGTVKNIAAIALKAMVNQYRCEIKNIIAGIGPSISAQCYEVGPEVVAQVRIAFGDHAGRILLPQNGTMHFDLWEANRILLDESGVENIEISGLCTAGISADWYSHRGERGKTGRFGVLIGLD